MEKRQHIKPAHEAAPPKAAKPSLGKPPAKGAASGAKSSPELRIEPARKSFGIPEPEGASGPAVSSDFEITGYGGSGEMDAVLLTGSGAFDAAVKAAELESHKNTAGPPASGLDLDWEALPTNLRRGVPPKQGSAAERAPVVAPLAEVAAQRPKPSAAPAGEAAKAKEFHAIDVRKPKVGVLVMALLLLAGGVGLMFYKRHAMEAAASEVRAQIDSFEAERAPLYEELGQAARDSAPVQTNFCPRLGDVAADTTFVFSGDPIQVFPTENRGARELARYEAYLDEAISRATFEDGNRALDAVGNAVVYVRVQNWRRARVSSSVQAANSYSNFAPGYLIGDAYVGDAATGRSVCSFRFFANSSRSVRVAVSPEIDMANDLLTQVYAALNAGLRGVRAIPGENGGRYEALQPPTGY